MSAAFECRYLHMRWVNEWIRVLAAATEKIIGLNHLVLRQHGIVRHVPFPTGNQYQHQGNWLNWESVIKLHCRETLQAPCLPPFAQRHFTSEGSVVMLRKLQWMSEVVVGDHWLFYSTVRPSCLRSRVAHVSLDGIFFQPCSRRHTA